MLTPFKISLVFLVTGICWAFVSDPVITYFIKTIHLPQPDLFRSVNHLVFVIVLSSFIYTLLKTRQNLIAKSEEEYKQLFESNPNPMWIFKIDNLMFLKVNNAAVDKYGYGHEQFLKMSILEIRPKADHEKVKDDLKHAFGSVRHAGVWLHVKNNGEIFPVSISSHQLTFKKQNCMMVMATDITELVDKERTIREAHEKIKTSHETLLQVAWANSHEIRRPFCSIQSLIELMKQAQYDLEKEEYLHLLGICADELNDALNKSNKKLNEMNL